MNKKIVKVKKKIAIFDLTDCEGCELEFIASALFLFKKRKSAGCPKREINFAL